MNQGKPYWCVIPADLSAGRDGDFQEKHHQWEQMYLADEIKIGGEDKGDKNAKNQKRQWLYRYY